MTTADMINMVMAIIQMLTLLIAGGSVWWQLKKANEDRQDSTYDSLDARYTRFLEVCSEHPELEVYNPVRDNWAGLSSQQHRRQLILYQILVSLFERAYILYNDPHTLESAIRRNQWAGWLKYMREYADSPTFRYAWALGIGEDMDKGFLDFMTNTIKVGVYTP